MNVHISSIRSREWQDQSIQLEYFVAKEAEKTYIQIPFTVTGPVERIEVRYEYERSQGSTVIDIGLQSPERIVGWSGGARESFFVALEKATPGYMAGPIPEGEWSILLGAYRTREPGCIVKLEINIINKQPRWLKGDLHMHSVHSDGSYAIAEVIELCKNKGLDFIALTDHNNASQNRSVLAPDDQLVIIPGVELTSYKGHANLFGHLDVLDDFRVLTNEQASRTLGTAADKGALVSLNHPFCSDCPWEMGFDVPYDAIEVWNGPWRKLNETAVRWWHDQLAAGKRIVAIGGSDTHRSDPYVAHGRPTTYVYTDSETASSILTAIRNGHVVLSCDADETVIELAINDAIVGDELAVNGEEELAVKVQVTGAKGDRLLLWSDRGIELEWIANSGDPYSFTVSADRLFYRAEAYRYMKDWDVTIMSGLTNPIYLRKQSAEAVR